MNRVFFAACVACLLATTFARAAESDAALRQKLLGYWGNPRHSYLIAPDGFMYMCPRDISTTKMQWEVRDGKFYLDGKPHQIVTLTAKTFAFRGDGVTFTYKRLTQQQAEGR